MNLIKEFERNNALIGKQKALEQRKMAAARDLVKRLKNELMQAQKARDSLRSDVYIQRKQLEKHAGNLNQEQADRSNLLTDIRREADGVVDTTVSRLKMMSRASKEYQPPKDAAKLGESLIIHTSSKPSSVFNSKPHRSLNSSRKQSAQQSKLGSRKTSVQQMTRQ